MSTTRLCDLEQDILAQHGEIRARMRGLVCQAIRSPSAWQRRGMEILLLRFIAIFEAHLAFEERELAPLLRGVDSWGDVRESELLAEHRDQRRLVEDVGALVDEPGDGTGEALASAVKALCSHLIEDMIHEEAALVELVRIEAYGHTDQMTG
jgi:hypothetical protein